MQANAMHSMVAAAIECRKLACHKQTTHSQLTLSHFLFWTTIHGIAWSMQWSKVIKDSYGEYVLLISFCMHSIDSLQQPKPYWVDTVQWRFVRYIWVECSMPKKKFKWHQPWQISLVKCKDSFTMEIGICLNFTFFNDAIQNF